MFCNIINVCNKSEPTSILLITWIIKSLFRRKAKKAALKLAADMILNNSSEIAAVLGIGGNDGNLTPPTSNTTVTAEQKKKAQLMAIQAILKKKK